MPYFFGLIFMCHCLNWDTRTRVTQDSERSRFISFLMQIAAFNVNIWLSPEASLTTQNA